MQKIKCGRMVASNNLAMLRLPLFGVANCIAFTWTCCSQFRLTTSSCGTPSGLGAWRLLSRAVLYVPAHIEWVVIETLVCEPMACIHSTACFPSARHNGIKLPAVKAMIEDVGYIVGSSRVAEKGHSVVGRYVSQAVLCSAVFAYSFLGLSSRGRALLSMYM